MRPVARTTGRESTRGGRRCAGLRVVVATTIGFAMITAACYTYRPVGMAPAAHTGDELRIHLTEQGTSELTRYLGPRVIALDGQLMHVGADSTLTLGVSMLHFVDGTSYPFTGEGTVPVSCALIGSVERRTFSPSRTAFVSAGVVAGLVAVARAALHTGHVSPGGGIGGPPPP